MTACAMTASYPILFRAWWQELRGIRAVSLHRRGSALKIVLLNPYDVLKALTSNVVSVFEPFGLVPEDMYPHLEMIRTSLKAKNLKTTYEYKLQDVHTTKEYARKGDVQSYKEVPIEERMRSCNYS